MNSEHILLQNRALSLMKEWYYEHGTLKLFTIPSAFRFLFSDEIEWLLELEYLIEDDLTQEHMVSHSGLGFILRLANEMYACEL